jgi:hypothetical protein
MRPRPLNRRGDVSFSSRLPGCNKRYRDLLSEVVSKEKIKHQEIHDIYASA